MLKKLLLVALLLSVIVAGAASVLWRQAGELPTWYDPASASAEAQTHAGLNEPTSSGAADTPRPRRMTERLRSQLHAANQQTTDAGHELRLDETELNALLLESLDARPDGQRIRQATKAIHAELKEDRLVVGAVTDLDSLLAASENERERSAIRKLKSLAPWLRGQDFYLGVEGQPQARNGRLALDNLTVKVGRLSLSPEDLAARFGLSDKLAEEDLTVGLPEMTVEDVRVENETLLLSLIGKR